jgi:hypothetical protein
MATLAKHDLIQALTRLGELALSHGQTLDLMLLGGGVMVLEFEARLSTRDLDVVILPPSEPATVRQWAATVAVERGWTPDWLNDAAKGFVIGAAHGPTIFEAPGIRVIRPATEQLLAMKLCAWRDDVDIADARRLLKEMSGSYNVDEAWSKIAPFLQPGRELTAKYAFDDLREELHGSD